MAAKINLKITSDFDQASKDLKEFGTITEAQRKRVEKFQNEFKSDNIDKFMDKNRRSAAAVKATSGALAGAQAEHRGLQREIQKLIRKGLDPQDDALKPLIKRYDQLEKEMNDASGSAKKQSRTFSALDGVMLGMGAAAVGLAKQGFQRLAQFTADSAQAAADAQEVYGKFSVVFGGVQQSANRAAQSLAEDFDLASSTAQKLLGDTGDLLTGFGLTESAALELSEQTNRLAIDLASFTNAQGGAEAVSKALTSAYAGEREALKTYGIVINEAAVQARILENEQKGLTFASEQQAEAAATLQLAQEQSKNAIGDYARTSESAANTQRRLGEQTKRLKENYGEFVQEGLTPARSALAGMLTQLNETIESSRSMREAIAAFREEGEGSLEGMGLEETNKQLELQKKRLEELTANQVEGMNVNQELIRQTEAYIESLENQASQLRVISAMEARAAGQDQESAQILKDKIRAQKENAAALERSQEINQASLTTQEKKLQKLGDEIDKWAKIRNEIRASGEDYSEVQDLINQLVEDRNDILEAQAQKELEQRQKVQQAWAESSNRIQDYIEERRQAEIHAAKEEFEHYNEMLSKKEDASIASFRRVADMAREAGVEEAKIQEWLTNKIIAYRKEQAQSAFEMANSVMGVFSAINDLQSAQAEAELQRMEEAGASEEELAQRKKEIARDEAKREKKFALFQVAIDTAAAIVEAFPNFILMALAATTGAIQAAAINAQPIPTAQTGGEFEIPPSRTGRGDNVGVMAQEGETVSVRPRGEGGMMQNISITLNGDILTEFINDRIESGEIRITSDNIQGGISV